MEIETVLVIGLLAVIAYAVYAGKIAVPGLGNISLNINLPQSIIQGSNQPASVTHTANLCQLFMPYFIQNGFNGCLIDKQGMWSCTADYVGCTNARVAIDCTGPMMQVASVQCTAAGAQSICDVSQAVCKY
jgi:hypothetical protein